MAQTLARLAHRAWYGAPPAYAFALAVLALKDGWRRRIGGLRLDVAAGGSSHL